MQGYVILCAIHFLACSFRCIVPHEFSLVCMTYGIERSIELSIFNNLYAMACARVKETNRTSQTSSVIFDMDWMENQEHAVYNFIYFCFCFCLRIVVNILPCSRGKSFMVLLTKAMQIEPLNNSCTFHFDVEEFLFEIMTRMRAVFFLTAVHMFSLFV